MKGPTTHKRHAEACIVAFFMILAIAQTDQEDIPFKRGYNLTFDCPIKQFDTTPRAAKWKKHDETYQLSLCFSSPPPRCVPTTSYNKRYKYISNSKDIKMTITNVSSVDVGTYICFNPNNRMVKNFTIFPDINEDSTRIYSDKNSPYQKKNPNIDSGLAYKSADQGSVLSATSSKNNYSSASYIIGALVLAVSTIAVVVWVMGIGRKYRICKKIYKAGSLLLNECVYVAIHFSSDQKKQSEDEKDCLKGKTEESNERESGVSKTNEENQEQKQRIDLKDEPT